MSSQENKFSKEQEKQIKKIATDTLRGAFTFKSIGDSPTDNLQLTNRGYVNLFGTTALRPTASVASRGQQYFDTTIGRPVYFNPNSSVWTDGAGSVS